MRYPDLDPYQFAPMLLLLARLKVSTTLVDGKPAAVVGVAVGVLVEVLIGVKVAGIDVDVYDGVGGTVAVEVGVNVTVLEGVNSAVGVGLFVAVLVRVGPGVNVNVEVGRLVAVFVAVDVRVAVEVGVRVGVAVCVLVEVAESGVLVGPVVMFPPPKLSNKASGELASHKPI